MGFMRPIRTKSGSVVLVHDHDRARLEALERRGGRVIGWIDGYCKVLMPKEGFDGPAKA